MANEVIAFADAEAVMVAYLKSVLLGTTVATKVPNPRPDRIVKVTRVGGTRRDLVTDSAFMLFECWDKTDVAASDLCRTVRAYVGSLPGSFANGVWIYRVTESGGPAYFPDPSTTLPRYQFTVQIDLRGGTL